jgi:hypothetical protein
VRIPRAQFEREAAEVLRVQQELWIKVEDNDYPGITEYYSKHVPVTTALSDFMAKHPGSSPVWSRCYLERYPVESFLPLYPAAQLRASV